MSNYITNVFPFNVGKVSEYIVILDKLLLNSNHTNLKLIYQTT